MLPRIFFLFLFPLAKPISVLSLSSLSDHKSFPVSRRKREREKEKIKDWDLEEILVFAIKRIYLYYCIYDIIQYIYMYILYIQYVYTVYIYINTYSFIYIHLCIHTHTYCTYIHTYTHKHTHIHSQTHTQSDNTLPLTARLSGHCARRLSVEIV